MTSNSGSIAQDKTWKSKEQSEENRYFKEKEQAQLSALRDKASDNSASNQQKSRSKDDFEGGYGGQEDLEDRYATTSGEH